MIRIIVLLFLGALLTACVEEDQVVKHECSQLPIETHLPRFVVLDDQISVSFVSRRSDSTSSTGISSFEEDRFSEPFLDQPRTDMFINWADFPSSAFYLDTAGNTRGFQHWLQYSGKGTYDYDILYLDVGIEDQHNPGPQKLHLDTVSAEHGFISSAQLPRGGLQVTWLDGRHTKQDMGADAGAENVGKAKDEHGHGGGSMTLRTKALSDSFSVELDHRVCDCCNTATAATDSLVMIAYRDRSEHEIRDISYVIKPWDSEEWSVPKTVHADNWKMSGCPVNGPALAANGPQNIAIVWYTAPADRAQINFSRYDPAADRFSPPITLDDDLPYGRVDLQLAPDGTAYATGLTSIENSDDAHLTLWTVAPDNSVSREVIATTTAGRSSGFPKIALHNDKLFWARTVVGDSRDEHYVEVCWQSQL